MIPYIALAFYYQARRKNLREFAIYTGFFLLGCLTTGIFLLPTLLKYGLTSPGGTSTASMVMINVANLGEFVNYLIKLIAFACYDTTRFIGGDSPQRILYYYHYMWAAPFTLFLTAVG